MMDSIQALAKVYESLSRGASALDFSPSDITGDCAAHVQEIVRERMSGKPLEKAISSALSCMNDGSGLVYLGLISAGMGYWTYSVKAYEIALKVYEKLGDVHGAALTYNNLGLVYAKMGEWPKAIELYQKSLETYEKTGDMHGAAKIYGNLGLVCVDMGEWPKAIELYKKALKVYEKLGDVHGAAKIYGNLGLVYAQMGEWPKAIELYQKIFETFEKLGDVHGVAQTHNNLGLVYVQMGEWPKAIELYQKSLETFETLGDVHGTALTYNSLGLVYADMSEWPKAIELYQKSLETLETLGDIHGTTKTYGNFGSMYYRMGEWPKAIELYQKSLETLETLGDVHGVALTYNNLGLVYSDMGEWPKAIELYEKSLEKSETLGDVFGKGRTLSNLGKLHLDKKLPEPEEARKCLEESIKLLNREARPDYPNALNWLALCYHKLGSKKKREAKKDRKNQDELVKTSSNFFSRASELYRDVASLPRIDIASLKMYVHLDKGLSLSVMNVIEENDNNALKILDSALLEFRKALEFADEKEKIRLQGVISDHEAKRYLRLAALEKNPDKQNQMLDKAIEALLNAASDFERLGDTCSNTCQGCSHLFQGLKLYRTGIRDKNNKALFDSAIELREARKSYEKAENELGKDTVEVLSRSFKLVEEQIKSKDQIIVMKIAPEFIEIIEELSAVGLRKMIKMYTFDEGMNVKKEESSEGKRTIHIEKVQGNVIYTEGNSDIRNVINQPAPPSVPIKPESLTDRLANPATLAGFVGWAGGLVFTIYGYIQSNTYSLIIGIVVFVVLAALKLWKKL